MTAAGKSFDDRKDEGIVHLKAFNELLLKRTLETLQGAPYDLNMKVSDAGQSAWAFDRWMALIFVAGPDLRITFKIHFDDDMISVLNIDETGDEKKDKESLQDACKELANLIGGQAKLFLEGNDFAVGLSLPISTSGFDEVFFRIQRSKFLTQTENRKIVARGETFFISVASELLMSKSIEKLAGIKEENYVEPDNAILF